MSELELYGKVININNLFMTNNLHKENIKTLSYKYSKNMQYAYKSVIESLSKNFPTCANRTNGRVLFFNCGTWFQSEILVGM